MDLKNWVAEYVESNETAEEAIKQVVINALLCAKKHHLQCTLGEGAECAKTYNDLLEQIYNDKVEFNLNERG
jgi:hypothetical protein